MIKIKEKTLFKKIFGILAILLIAATPALAQSNAIQTGSMAVNVIEGCTIDVSILDVVFDPSALMENGWLPSTSADPAVDISWRFATCTPMLTLTLGVLTNDGNTLNSLNLFRYSALGFSSLTGLPLVDVLSRGANGSTVIYNNTVANGSDSGTIKFEIDEAELLAQDLVNHFPVGPFAGVLVFKITGNV